VAGNDDRIVSHPGKIGFRGLDRPVDASARRIIDKRIDSVPKRVTVCKTFASENMTEMSLSVWAGA